MTKRITLLLITVLFISMNAKAQKIMPYYTCGELDGDVKTVKEQVKKALKDKGFSITGGYYVSNYASMYVLTFTSDELKKICLKVKERGIIATNLRVGFKKISDTKTELIVLNPKYMFLGYLRKSYDTYKTELDNISNEVTGLMKSFANTLEPFGGSVSEKELKNYHYMAMMPYFDDPIELKEFDSFEDAISTIDKNLAAKKGKCIKVYKLSFSSSKKAVYGVGLHDKENGEPHFMPIIGTKHFVAMPYELVVEDGKVTMLHGKFRFAMYWPALTMGTFTKIMSTPGDIEDLLKALTE